MSRTRTLIIALALAAALPAGMAHLTGCEKSADAPVYDNPFDPDGPQAGDALEITATATSNIVSVKWVHHSGRDISMYVVDHRTDLETEWTALGDTTLDDDSVESIYFIHLDPDPNRTHYYLVQGLTSGGDFTVTSLTTPGVTITPPVVLLDANPQKLASRYVGMKIVTGEGDSIRVADNPGFTGAVVLPSAAPGDTARLTWDFGLRAADDSLGLHVQSFGDDGYASSVYSRSLKVVFEPDFAVIGGAVSGNATKVPGLVNDLRVVDDGVERMRFASSEAGLAAAAWVPGDTIYEDFTLEATTDIQYIWGEFEGDFGFTATSSLRVRPDLLGDASFELVLPDNRVISRTRVGVICEAAATEMRFSDDGDFTSNPAWLPFAESDSVDFTADAAGPVIIFAQFKNDWNTRTDLSDSLYFVLMPLSAYFVTPFEGEVVESGSTYTVSGRALVADGGLMQSLELDLGTGSFLGYPIAQDWSADWNVPAVTDTTGMILRVRASADGEVVTDAVSVTVVPNGD